MHQSSKINFGISILAKNPYFNLCFKIFYGHIHYDFELTNTQKTQFKRCFEQIVGRFLGFIHKLLKINLFFDHLSVENTLLGRDFVKNYQNMFLNFNLKLLRYETTTKQKTILELGVMHQAIYKTDSVVSCKVVVFILNISDSFVWCYLNHMTLKLIKKFCIFNT